MLSLSQLIAQEDNSLLTVYGEVGGIVLPCLGCESGGSDLIFSAQFSGERNKGRNATATRFSMGAIIRDDQWHPKVSLSGVLLTGKGNSHFEVDYGVMFSGAVDPKLLPIINLGYRFQDLSESGMVFRAGLGLEYLGPYISVGRSF